MSPHPAVTTEYRCRRQNQWKEAFSWVLVFWWFLADYVDEASKCFMNLRVHGFLIQHKNQMISTQHGFLSIFFLTQEYWESQWEIGLSELEGLSQCVNSGMCLHISLVVSVTFLSIPGPMRAPPTLMQLPMVFNGIFILYLQTPISYVIHKMCPISPISPAIL